MQKGFTRNFEPLKILSEEKLKKIHRGVLDVLENTGVKFESEKALELFEDNSCKVDREKMTVKFSPGIVEDCLKKVPSSFKIQSRDPDNDMIIGGDTVYFEASVGQDFFDPDTMAMRPATLKENAEGVTVLDALENVHSLLSYCPYMNLAGVPPALQITTSAACRFKNSTKISRTAHFSGSEQFAIQMAYAADQDIIISMEPSPPLAWGPDAIEAGFRACKTPFSVRFSNGDIMGATSPATIAGSLVTAIAENISGIVMVNLLQPGKQVAVDNFVFPMDMIYGQPDFNSIISALHSAGFNQVFRSYGVPVVTGTGQFSLAKNIGYQIGMEKALSLIISALSGSNIINAAGGLFAELSWNPVLAVMDNDLIGAVGRFIEGIDVNDEMLATNLIDKVITSSSNFLCEQHMREWWKKEFYVPEVMDRLPYDLWKGQGKKNAIDKAKEKVEDILATHKVSVPLTEEQNNEIDKILHEAKRYYEKLGLI
jgi:trimethylamine--corrinoid protein Co-methyltransferase